MLERLVQLRWLRRSGRDYELGMRLVELGSLAVHQDRLVRAASPLLDELHCATGLVVHLVVMDGPDVVYLEKIGDRMMAAIPTRVGGRQPAHCTAAGKAILAYCDEDAAVDLQVRKTRYSISNSAQLAVELAKVRAHGVAFEREESLPGFGCVAAPIGNPGEAVAAVSVCGPMNRHDVRSAAGRSGADDRNGYLAQPRGRPAAGGADPATAATTAAPASRTRVATGLAVRVTLDPQIATLIETLDAGFPPVHTMTGAQARALIRSRFVPAAQPEPVAEVRDETIPGPGGYIPVRIYRPDRPGVLPILVYAHGGGFVFCDLDSHDGLCRDFANRLGAVVISVGYRLAPENPWPAAAYDFTAATQWAHDNALAIGGDARRDGGGRRQCGREPGRSDRADGTR